MKKKTNSNETMIYKSPFLRTIVFIFFVFIPFQLFLVYFIQLLKERINPTQKKEKIISIPTQTVSVTSQPKPLKEPATTPKQEKKAATPKKKAAPASKDDLQLISGIGPKTREAMNEQGISTYAQIAALSLEALNQILEDAGLRIKASQSWIDQANKLK